MMVCADSRDLFQATWLRERLKIFVNFIFFVKCYTFTSFAM